MLTTTSPITYAASAPPAPPPQDYLHWYRAPDPVKLRECLRRRIRKLRCAKRPVPDGLIAALCSAAHEVEAIQLGDSDGITWEVSLCQ